MKVQELMTADVLTVKRSTTLREAAALLVEKRVSGVPVVDDAGKVIGVLSEADVLAKAGGPGAEGGFLAWLFDMEPDTAKVTASTVGEAMSTPPVTIGPARRVHEAARLMLDEQVNRLPVVKDDILVGIVTRADIVRAFARSDTEIAAEIRDEVLQRTFWVQPGQVTVTVADGRVDIAGEVETDADAEMLPVFVSRVPGVVSVHADLRARTAVA